MFIFYLHNFEKDVQSGEVYIENGDLGAHLVWTS